MVLTTLSVGMVSIFMQEPKHSHIWAVEKIWRYLQGIVDHGVYFPNTSRIKDGEKSGLCVQALQLINLMVFKEENNCDVMIISEVEYIDARNVACQGNLFAILVVWNNGWKIRNGT